MRLFAKAPNPGQSIAVLGVDDDSMLCESVDTPLSSVRHDLAGMAYWAAALLDRLMDGGEAPETIQRVRLKGITTRRSTDVLALDAGPPLRRGCEASLDAGTSSRRARNPSSRLQLRSCSSVIRVLLFSRRPAARS